MKGATMKSAFERRRWLAGSVAAAAMVAAAWGWPPQARASDAATFKAAYEAAVAARKSVRAAGFEWRDIKKMLRDARKLAKKGEFAKAVELADRAKHQGELGLIQAEEQASAWREAVLK